MRQLAEALGCSPMTPYRWLASVPARPRRMIGPRGRAGGAVSILVSLVPFAVFLGLMRLISPLAGLVGALLASLVLCLRMWWRRESVKILEVGSLTLFGLLIACTLLATPSWTVATVSARGRRRPAHHRAPLAVGRPFTLPCARERVPEAFWALPIFHVTNRAMSAVWGLAFAVNTTSGPEHIRAHNILYFPLEPGGKSRYKRARGGVEPDRERSTVCGRLHSQSRSF
jgi:hypothetical protein